MKRNLIIIAVCCLIALGIGFVASRLSFETVSEPPKTTQFQTSPTLSLTDHLGRSLDVPDKKGRIILLNFWATWCPPCVVEFPELVQFATTHEEDVVLVALSVDQNDEILERFLTQTSEKHDLDLSLPNIHVVRDADKSITFDVFKTMRFPETIVIDGEGNMLHKQIGEFTPESLKEIVVPFFPRDK